MSDRRKILARISRRLGRRDLIWGGLRSDDVEAITDLEQVAGSFSIVGGNGHSGAVPRVEFEDISGSRVDLDTWDIENHLETEPVHQFREGLLRRLAGPTALLPYRSSRFLSSILFARRDRCLDLGLFGEHQAVFEHKPWVETRVAELGLSQIPWVYVADEEQVIARRMLAQGPIMLRVSRSSGGAGLVRVEEADELKRLWPFQREAFVSVTPYLDRATPVNVGATVWHDGVSVHHPSVQLVGIEGCTVRPFGFCGNDFGGGAGLEHRIQDEIESSVFVLAHWLRGLGYRGTFGVDFLVHDGVPRFAEINPRFQGSTHASSQLSSEAGESCVLLDHIAAVLGENAPRRRPIRELSSRAPRLSHLVVHWTRPRAFVDASGLVKRFRAQGNVSRVDVEAKPTVVTDTGGVVVRVTVRDRMTTTGFDLTEPWKSVIDEWASSEVACKGNVCKSESVHHDDKDIPKAQR